MSRYETSCPICNADIPLAGDERAGDEVYCSACGAPCKLAGGDDGDDFAAEEDY